MSEYTPGPWEAVIDEEQPVPYYTGLVAILENGENYKSVVTKNGRQVHPDEWEANTKLIAKAPELLKLLRYIRDGAMKESCGHEAPDLTWHCCTWNAVVEEINEVINKIEGDDE